MIESKAKKNASGFRRKNMTKLLLLVTQAAWNFTAYLRIEQIITVRTKNILGGMLWNESTTEIVTKKFFGGYLQSIYSF